MYFLLQQISHVRLLLHYLLQFQIFSLEQGLYHGQLEMQKPHGKLNMEHLGLHKVMVQL